MTGANGFVGSHLTEALLARGYRVRCMVRQSSDLVYIRDLPVEWAYADLRVGADLRDGAGLAAACQDVDAVCHCAALTRAPDEQTFLRVNAAGTEALARTALEANPNLERFLFLSSQAAAGPAPGRDRPVDEAYPPQPVTWYGKSKLAAERALTAMNPALPATIIRSAAVFGPRDRDFFSYFELVKWRVSLYPGRNEQLLSLAYVHDLVALILLALESDRAAGSLYYASSFATSHRQLAEAIARSLGKRPVHIVVPDPLLSFIASWSRAQARLTGKTPLLNDQRIIDMRQPYWLCTAEKAGRELGYRPASDLGTAIQETADWYLENGWL
ncbi:MAG: NAD-dependent epimerase/dehydratase family protein [Anaerolineae bacterium]|nr:NAD-dependent epimerase/dehydratase family protein [Anaerolineae bacterium]